MLYLFIGQTAAIGLSLKVFLTSVILYPIIEEFAFRGFVQSWLLEKKFLKASFFKVGFLKALSGANVITSMLFAAMHLFNQPPVWAALVFAPSLVFGYLRERYNAVIPSVVIHSWYNLGFLWLFSGA